MDAIKNNPEQAVAPTGSLQRDQKTLSDALVYMAVGGFLLTFAGVAIALWQISNDPATQLLTESTYFLAVAVVVFLCVLRTKGNDLTKAEDQLRSTKDQTSILVNEMDSRYKSIISALESRADTDNAERLLSEGLLSLAVLLQEQPHVDAIHHFTSVQEEYVIQGQNGTYNWHFEGYNGANDQSTELVLKISGDFPIEYDSMGVTARDTLTRNDLEVELRSDYPHIKVVAIPFPTALQPNESFSLEVSCNWPNVFPFTQKTNYVFFSWGSFAANGIDSFRCRLVSDVPISYLLEKLETRRRETVAPQPREIRTDPRTVLEWSIRCPKDIYVLSFWRIGS